MAGHETARDTILDAKSHAGNVERTLKHWIIASSAGYYNAFNSLQIEFKEGHVSRKINQFNFDSLQ
jgi:hypothetical protein